MNALTQALEVRGHSFRNRLVQAPMCAMYASADGSVTPQVIEYYRARALGGVGVNQELPVDESHPSDPQAVQRTRDPRRLQTVRYARGCWWRAFPVELCDPHRLSAGR